MYELNFCEQFENLSPEDVLRFQEAVTRLMNSTYINRYQSNNKWDPNYLFIEKHIVLLQSYFKYAGFELKINKTIGVVSVASQFSFARKKTDKETTLYILALRLLYDEKSKEFNGTSTIVVRVADFIDKLIEYGIYDKKPNIMNMARILRYLSTIGILDKTRGKWEEVDTSFIIYPAILLLLPIERLNQKLQLIEKGVMDDD